MTLVKLNNVPVRKSFHSFVDEFLNEFPSILGKDAPGFNPPANVHETKDAYHLELSAPGLNKEDFAIGIEDGILNIGFEQKEEKNTEDYNKIKAIYESKSTSCKNCNKNKCECK